MFLNGILNTEVLAEGLRCWKLKSRGLLFLLDWYRFWRMKVHWFSVLRISVCCLIWWDNITLPKN